jgi:hypothetical protein
MEKLFKNIISAQQHTGKGEKKLERKGGGGRVNLLDVMTVTFPTSQVERSPLKAPAPANTVYMYTATKRSPKIKMG